MPEQRVELGVQARAVGHPELGAELQPAVADGRAQLDHDLAIAREAGEDVLQLGEHRSRERCRIEPEPERAWWDDLLGLLLPGFDHLLGGGLKGFDLGCTTMHVLSRSL